MKQALLLLLLVATPALAQSDKSPPPADFKPLIAPVLPPLVLPPNSYISPGSITNEPASPYSSSPGYDAARSGPAPGLRLTIPDSLSGRAKSTAAHWYGGPQSVS